MALVNEHLWEFPHTMTLKAMGATDSPIVDAVSAILSEHVASFDPNENLHTVPSKKGNFISVNARITVDNVEQVKAIYGALNSSPHVKMVL